MRQFRDVAQGDVADRILLDGEHLIEEAVASGIEIEIAAFTDPIAHGTFARRFTSATKAVIVSDAVLNAMSPVRSPSGAVAIAKRPRVDLARVFARTPQLILCLHGIQDPGNVGAIVRAAEGCGATGIICSERTADPFGWKALRGSMGSTFRLPLATRQSLPEAIDVARGKGLRVICHQRARRHAAAPNAICACPQRSLLGGEGAGLPRSVVDAADERLTIPMQPPVESLNVAVAAALVVYEAARQRHRDRAHVAL